MEMPPRKCMLGRYSNLPVLYTQGAPVMTERFKLALGQLHSHRILSTTVRFAQGFCHRYYMTDLSPAPAQQNMPTLQLFTL